MLQIGDELRDRGMRYAELRGSLRKTAVLYDHEEHVQVPQPQTPADVTVPVDDLGHKRKLSGLKVK